jgi:GntR family phosphonate transport system transcriptional regulator
MSRSDRIDRNRPAALWAQVRDDLVARIESGELTGRLPSEFDLANDYAVGRDTIRHAVAELADAGTLTVVRGVGTFVASAD